MSDRAAFTVLRVRGSGQYEASLMGVGGAEDAGDFAERWFRHIEPGVTFLRSLGGGRMLLPYDPRDGGSSRS